MVPNILKALSAFEITIWPLLPKSVKEAIVPVVREVTKDMKNEHDLNLLLERYCYYMICLFQTLKCWARNRRE